MSTRGRNPVDQSNTKLVETLPKQYGTISLLSTSTQPRLGQPLEPISVQPILPSFSAGETSSNRSEIHGPVSPKPILFNFGSPLFSPPTQIKSPPILAPIIVSPVGPSLLNQSTQSTKPSSTPVGQSSLTNLTGPIDLFPKSSSIVVPHGITSPNFGPISSNSSVDKIRSIDLITFDGTFLGEIGHKDIEQDLVDSRGERFWLLRKFFGNHLVQVREISSIQTILVDEMKKSLGLPNLGTRWVIYSRKIYLIQQPYFLQDGRQVTDQTLEIVKNVESRRFKRLVQYTWIFRDIFALGSNFEKSIIIRRPFSPELANQANSMIQGLDHCGFVPYKPFVPPGIAYPICGLDGQIDITNSRLFSIPVKIHEKWFRDGGYSRLLKEFLNINLFRINTDLEKIGNLIRNNAKRIDPTGTHIDQILLNRIIELVTDRITSRIDSDPIVDSTFRITSEETVLESNGSPHSVGKSIPSSQNPQRAGSGTQSFSSRLISSKSPVQSNSSQSSYSGLPIGNLQIETPHKSPLRTGNMVVGTDSHDIDEKIEFNPEIANRLMTIVSAGYQKQNLPISGLSGPYSSAQHTNSSIVSNIESGRVIPSQSVVASGRKGRAAGPVRTKTDSSIKIAPPSITSPILLLQQNFPPQSSKFSIKVSPPENRQLGPVRVASPHLLTNPSSSMSSNSMPLSSMPSSSMSSSSMSSTSMPLSSMSSSSISLVLSPLSIGNVSSTTFQPQSLLTNIPNQLEYSLEYSKPRGVNIGQGNKTVNSGQIGRTSNKMHEFIASVPEDFISPYQLDRRLLSNSNRNDTEKYPPVIASGRRSQRRN